MQVVMLVWPSGSYTLSREGFLVTSLERERILAERFNREECIRKEQFFAIRSEDYGNIASFFWYRLHKQLPARLPSSRKTVMDNGK